MDQNTAQDNNTGNVQFNYPDFSQNTPNQSNQPTQPTQPTQSVSSDDEKKILIKEMCRYEHFAEHSRYPLDAMNRIFEIKRLYELV